MKYGKKGFSSVTDAAPIVKTRNGLIRGFYRNQNAVFLGIPYGGHCDGASRFKEAQPAGDWDGVLNCTTYGAIAMQDVPDTDLLPEPVRKVVQDYADVFTGGVPFDKKQEKPHENCLYLNVVTPRIDDQKRPILAYIHGGGYMNGSGGVTAAICDRLIDEEDLVVVTINHRLNAFGSLYLGSFDSEYAESGIVTQLDLVLALKWIQENIAAFGGDPDSVTLIGESGGGMKIHHLLSMPECKGLFHRAIMISGSVPSAAKTKEQGTSETLKVLKNLGIRKEDWRRLLTVPAQELLAAIRGLELIQPNSTPFMPTADGVRMPINKNGSFHVCPEMAHIPVIIGFSEEELAANVLNPVLTWDGLRDVLLKRENPLLQVVSGITEENVDEVIRAFRQKDDIKAPWQILAQIVSTAHFLGGGSYVASLTRAQADCKVWHYTTTFDTPVPGAGVLSCAWHTADLPLAFRAVYHAHAEALSKTIAHSFAAFVRTGDPNTSENPWKPFTTAHKETMLFDLTPACENDPYREIYQILSGVSPTFKGGFAV